MKISTVLTQVDAEQRPRRASVNDEVPSDEAKKKGGERKEKLEWISGRNTYGVSRNGPNPVFLTGPERSPPLQGFLSSDKIHLVVRWQSSLDVFWSV
jgi:hypothetical protein